MDLVIMKEKQTVTSSLQVAETFGKNHQHILRDVDALKDVSNFGQMFVEANLPEKYIWTVNLQVQGQDKNTVAIHDGIKGNPNKVVISDGTIGKWDSRMPRADTLRKVAGYLGVTTAYILDRAKEN